MYDRAPRVLRLAQRGCTEAHVGPGSYQVPFPERAKGSYAPFLSLSSRKSTYVVGKGAPGPAHYNISEAQYKIKGGHSLQYQEERFKKFASDSPGPASYNQPPPGTLCTVRRQKISRTRAVSRSIYVPSIPSSGKSHGYHLNDDDSIMQRTPPSSDDTIGPAYYNPQFDYPKEILKYKGINFAIGTGRQEIIKHSGPGPGQYDIIQKRRICYENINIKKDGQQKCKFIPRLYEELICQELKKRTPGPGKYEIKSQFEKTKCMTENMKNTASTFFSISERFVPIKSSTPAPGTYEEIRTSFKLPNKKSGLNSSFGQTATRFKQDSKAQEMPGPGCYDISGNIVIAKVQKALKKSKKTGFGSSVPQRFITVKKEVASSPGPCHYQVGGISDELPDLTNRNAAFLSRTERVVFAPGTFIPAPGSYDVQESYDKSQVKHKYMPPRTSVARKKHSSFLSTAPRCVEKIDDGPGPAAYSPVIRRSCAIISFIKGPKRFGQIPERSPGPTTYELSPFLRHTVLKKTYNVTLPWSSSAKREKKTGLPFRKKEKENRGNNVEYPNW
ncbi:sperm-tail PG-rich repeat-containing protein 2 [Psammomys obesus]|uniref:sperm-tail PG-rich repeat-containing protein 2 n=1 Tax=Psammomys obesus TaxID=48139 RepID=UPI002452CCE9|nr:sperm-tail PG-rich repeat-containing protein 2 [Psammomys obesus]